MFWSQIHSLFGQTITAAILIILPLLSNQLCPNGPQQDSLLVPHRWGNVCSPTPAIMEEGLESPREVGVTVEGSQTLVKNLQRTCGSRMAALQCLLISTRWEVRTWMDSTFHLSSRKCVSISWVFIVFYWAWACVQKPASVDLELDGALTMV